jgi:hypothetical protein
MSYYAETGHSQFQHFNAQGSRVIIVVGQEGAAKIYVTPVEEELRKRRKDRMTLSLPPKLVKKLVWV